MKQTMVACSQQCLNAMRKEGIKVLALLSQDVDAIDKIQCSVQTARWRRILEVRLPRRMIPHLLRWRRNPPCCAGAGTLPAALTQDPSLLHWHRIIPCCAVHNCRLLWQQRRMNPAFWQLMGVWRMPLLRLTAAWRC